MPTPVDMLSLHLTPDVAGTCLQYVTQTSFHVKTPTALNNDMMPTHTPYMMQKVPSIVMPAYPGVVVEGGGADVHAP
jgi:hypothetical protein